jgi:hypothetical protein
MESLRPQTLWLARAALTAVLVANMSAAIPYLIRPADYTAAYELSGVPGKVAVRGFGLLYLMWAVPFVPAILHPARHRVAFACVLAMQVIGLVGESLMLAALPTGHAALRATGLRFVAFDGAGLVVLLIAYGLLHIAHRRSPHGTRNT